MGEWFVSITEQRGLCLSPTDPDRATTVRHWPSGSPDSYRFTRCCQKQKKSIDRRLDDRGAIAPYMERLTWGGHRAAAGACLRYPESHGCIHLPSEFATSGSSTFAQRHMTRVLATRRPRPAQVANPGFISLQGMKFAGGPTGRARGIWRPRRTREALANMRCLPRGRSAACSVRLDTQRANYRNWIEIGRARFDRNRRIARSVQSRHWIASAKARE